MNAIVPIQAASNVEAYRASTDAAALCKEIVVACATTIQGRRYVTVEGWQAIAIAHGCAAAAHSVERVDGGVRAIGEVRRMSDGALISQAEGFVGEDEPTWYGGVLRGKTLPRRNDYAIRAMAQTRAISRACRSAFAHVVVMMQAGLSTTPAEEVPNEGFDNGPGDVIEHSDPTPRRSGPEPRTKLEGKHSSKTALKAAIQQARNKTRVAQTIRDLKAIWKEYTDDIRQAADVWPELLNGFPEIEEDIGLMGDIEKRKAELEAPAAAPAPSMFDMLIASMKECATLIALGEWRETNWNLIEALDDEGNRRFQREFEQFDAGLVEVERTTAGA